jgi:hypothetical protein
MKACGEVVTDHNIVSKTMRTLSYKFYDIVVTIEESKDLPTMKVEELQCSLEGHEQRVNERSKEISVDQALQAQTMKQNGGNMYKGKSKSKNGGSQSDNGKIEVNLQRMITMAKERRKTRKISNSITVRSMVTLQVNGEVKRSQDDTTMMIPK